MRRLIIVPQFPAKLRYQEWWLPMFVKEFSKEFEVYVLGEDAAYRAGKQNVEYGSDSFAPHQEAISFEMMQISEYMKLPLRADDILLLNDLSYPGFFANVLFHKKPFRTVAICHGTSANNLDYFSKDVLRKFPIESNLALMFDRVIVATEYHYKKLGWRNIEIIPFPDNDYAPVQVKGFKKYDVVSASRRTEQKRDPDLERAVEHSLDLSITTIHASSWLDYHAKLAASKILLISSKEETYGYQVLDAVKNGCIPIAPNNYSYPELLPPEYLYDNTSEAIVRVQEALSRELVPLREVKTKQASDKFFFELTKILKS